MIQRVLLVAWKGSSATGWVDALRAGGFQVLLEDTTGERAWRTAKERGIDLVIIDGQKKPSHGKATGNALRDTAKTRNIPIIWTNGNTDDESSVRSEVRPDVLLMAPTDAHNALSAIRTLQPETRAPSASVAGAAAVRVEGATAPGTTNAPPVSPGPVPADAAAEDTSPASSAAEQAPATEPGSDTPAQVIEALAPRELAAAVEPVTPHAPGRKSARQKIAPKARKAATAARAHHVAPAKRADAPKQALSSTTEKRASGSGSASRNRDGKATGLRAGGTSGQTRARHLAGGRRSSPSGRSQ